MSDAPFDWLMESYGVRPKLRWSFVTDAPLLGVQLARETGEVLAADASGGLYLLNRKGRIEAVTRGFRKIRAFAWSDIGRGGAALVGESTLCRFNRHLEVVWSQEIPLDTLDVAVDPHGRHLAVSLADGSTLIFNEAHQRIGQFSTARPLSCLRFVASEPALIGTAEHGLLCCFRPSGEKLWDEKLWSNTGDIAAAGDGSIILLACFTHGVQIYDGTGRYCGSYLLEGTASHVSLSFDPGRIVAATLERHLYWLDAQGELIWATEMPDDICHVGCDPLGSGVVCGLESGRLLWLDWE